MEYLESMENKAESKKNIIGVIPARMSSTRFPGKPLKKILDIPMVGHVYLRSKMSKLLDEVYIVTPDKEIAEYADSIGAKHVMGRNDHPGCSDITAEAVLKIEKDTEKKIDIVVMIQGDEPMVVPEMINLATKPLIESNAIEVVNLMTPIRSVEEHTDQNCPKVVVDKENFALYFSREPIPSRKKWKGNTIPMFKQVCIIPFKRDFLLQFKAWEPAPLERVESIDMIRVLEYGHKVKMVYEEFVTYAVDTPEDLKKVEKYMAQDSLVKSYA